MTIDNLTSKLETYENKALELGDVKTAIKLNWIKNAIRYDGMNLGDAVEHMLAVTILG